LVVVALLSATRDWALSSDSSEFVAIPVMWPLPNSNSALPWRKKNPVSVAGSAPVMSNVAAAVPPVRVIVPASALLSPAAVTVAAVVSPLLSMSRSPLLVSLPPNVRPLPPASPVPNIDLVWSAGMQPRKPMERELFWLLEAIRETGKLTGATTKAGLPYRQAWV
jgi:hypothetical protein